VSLKDLEELGVLLPEEDWGTHELHSAVNKPALVLAGLLGVMAVVLMYNGSGGTLTFVGSGLFLVFMAWVTHISISAIDRQAADFDPGREADAAGASPEGPTESGEQSPSGSDST